MSRRRWRIAIPVVAFAVAIWIGDAVVRTLLGDGTLTAQLIRPSASAIFTRLVLVPSVILAMLWLESLRQLRTAREETLAEREHILLLYEHTTDAIVFLDRDLRIIYINKVAERLGGTRLVECVGKPCYEAILGSEEQCAGCRALEVFGTREPREAIKHEVTAAGAENWLEQHWSPVFGRHGEVEAVLEVARDITDYKLLQRDVAECRALSDVARRRGVMLDEEG